MFKSYILRRFIDIITFKKSLNSCLFLSLSFFLSQTLSIGMSEEIIIYTNYIQENHPNSFWYHLAAWIKILFVEGSILALTSSLLIFLYLLYLVKNKETPFEELEVFDSHDLALKALGPDKDFRYSSNNLDGVSSMYDNTVSRTQKK